MEEVYQLLEMVPRGAMPNLWSYDAVLAFHCDHNEVNRAPKLISRVDDYPPGGGVPTGLAYIDSGA